MEIKTAYYKCHKCGNDIEFNAKVCPNCGTATKYGETLINNEKENVRAQRDARGYCRVVLIWTWFVTLLLPPVGFFVAIRGLVMATLARYRGFWAFILAILVSMGLTALIILLIVLGATGKLSH